MSDLAPFVAAALRDKVLLELQQENARLLQENERLKGVAWEKRGDIEITGPGGIPTYATYSFPRQCNATIAATNSQTWCPLPRLMECEFRIFGQRVTAFDEIVNHGECRFRGGDCTFPLLIVSQSCLVDGICAVVSPSMAPGDYEALVTDIEKCKKTKAFEEDWLSHSSRTVTTEVYFGPLRLSDELWDKIRREYATKKRKREAA